MEVVPEYQEQLKEEMDLKRQYVISFASKDGRTSNDFITE